MPLDFPSNPTSGQIYDNYYWDASNQIWRASGIITPKVPAGVISQYAGATAPSGYLLCTGQTLLASDYQDLFNAIGYTYGGSGSSFVIPNLQNRVPVGKGSDTEFDTLGETGGEKTVTLQTTHVPSHTHTFSGTTSGESGHTHGVAGISGLNGSGSGYLALQTDGNLVWYRGNGTTWASGQGAGGSTPGMSIGGSQSTTTGGSSGHTHTYSGTTSAGSGSGTAHNNLQPYIVLNYIIKT